MISVKDTSCVLVKLSVVCPLKKEKLNDWFAMSNFDRYRYWLRLFILALSLFWYIVNIPFPHDEAYLFFLCFNKVPPIYKIHSNCFISYL